jgi:PIN domain nuclease of toxin-antitoxin system
VSRTTTLSQAAAEAITRAAEAERVYVSSISCWEVALLVRRGRLQLTQPVDAWIAHSEELPFLTFVPVDNAIARRSVDLPGELHADPADRMIVATALTLGAPLVTRDDKLWRYPFVETIW